MRNFKNLIWSRTIIRGLCVALPLVALINASCTKTNKREPLRMGRSARTSPGSVSGGRNQNPQIFSGQQGGFVGAIYWEGAPQQFQEQVESFLSSILPLGSLGQVSANPADRTGIRFGGQVAFTNGSYRPNQQVMGSFAADNARSGLQILIWDSYAGSPDPQSGQVIPGILFDQFRLVNGTVSSQGTHLVFDDGAGTIELQGQLYGNDFWGTAYYNNRDAAEGLEARSGTLGQFYIQACQFFACY